VLVWTAPIKTIPPLRGEPGRGGTLKLYPTTIAEC
jgi:hypothetical protein